MHCLDGAELEGIAAATIERVGAVPLKYFQWFERPGRLASPRARDLMDLRGDIAAELAGSADVRPLPRPPGLARRYLQWYPRAVVPVVEALATDRTIVLTVNRADQGLVREMKVTVGATRVINDPGPPPPEPVAEWVRRFEMHERALQTAAAAPDRDRIEQALDLDPVVPDHAVAALTAELLEVAPA